jgi:hypothetical protein
MAQTRRQTSVATGAKSMMENAFHARLANAPMYQQGDPTSELIGSGIIEALRCHIVSPLDNSDAMTV